MAKKFFYKGLEIEQLQKMPLDEFLKIIPSKARRTMKRMSTGIKSFMEKMRKAKKGGKVMETHMRNAVVLPEMVGMRIKVYNGKEFFDVNIMPEMLGHRLGEYAITIKQVKHSGPGIGATRGSKSVELK
ncbi:MAG: 30S ribosomal protein S19 [Candidatus Micrarchaeia archaeon]|jgi:small subunit ribosomal protein S19